MHLKLEPSLDGRAAGPLAEEARRALADGAGLEIDAQAVQRAGLACLQLLLSARRTFAGQGIAFVLKAPSAAFADACRLAGANELLEDMDMQGSETCERF